MPLSGLHLSAVCAHVPCQQIMQFPENTDPVEPRQRCGPCRQGPNSPSCADRPSSPGVRAPRRGEGPLCCSSPGTQGRSGVLPPSCPGPRLTPCVNSPRCHHPPGPNPRAWRRLGPQEQGRKKPPVWERGSGPLSSQGLSTCQEGTSVPDRDFQPSTTQKLLDVAWVGKLGSGLFWTMPLG